MCYSGIEPARQLTTNRLERRLMEIGKIGTAEKRQIIQIIDTFTEHGKLEQRINAQEAP